MSKFSVEARDTYLLGLEKNSGQTVTVDLTAPEGQPGELKEIAAYIGEAPDGEYEQDKFAFVKEGNSVSITAPHVYRRFLNGERSPRPEREIPSNEELKQLHPDLGEKVRNTNFRKERTPKEPKQPKEGHSRGKNKGPKPVDVPEGEPAAV